MRAAALAAATAVFALATAGAAHGSAIQQTVVMDDTLFVYAQPGQLDKNLAEAKALGADTIRVSVYWNLLAPNPQQKQKPSSSYGESDPRFYPASAWDRYDRLVQLAGKHGLGVIFTLTGPAPLWATGRPEHGRSDIEDTWDPHPGDFKSFATAVATRYSGTWRDEHEQPSLIPLLPPTTTFGPALPRITQWSVWNEPNHPGWLTPQWQTPAGSKHLVPASPRIYRGLVDGAWSALQATGHGHDTFLLGETAPAGLKRRGPTLGIRPLRFIRELYCLDGKLRPYRGRAATQRGCPASGDPGAFAGAHPGLFGASGWAHHPYALTTSPGARDPDGDDAVLSGISRLTGTLDRIFARYGSSARLPVWITEYGYQTDPPDPTIGVRWGTQADWLDQATYRAFRNPRVAAMGQFLIVDDRPLTRFKRSDPRYWGSFQTGLVTLQGKRKPSFASFQHPIDVQPRQARRGRRLTVFGQLRTAPGGTHLTARIQFRPRGARKWQTVATVPVAGPRNFLLRRVRAQGSGSYRIAWQSGPVTRAVAVHVRR